MYIRNNTVAGFFGVDTTSNTGNIDTPFGELMGYHGDRDIILLDRERTLYDYELGDIYSFCADRGSHILTVLSQGLSAARGNGVRRWINTQNGRSNFNVNIFATTSKNQFESVWDLQERIATGIINTISGISKNINMAYPFHYLQDGGKIAGHLVQKKSISNDMDFLRIGIGINTDSQTPQLPNNDELAQILYSEPTTLSIGTERWIDLASNLRTNIMKSLDTNQHENYLRSLSIKHGDDIQIWGDDGTIAFGKKMARGQLDTIDRDGNIHLIGETSSIRLSDYHIQLMGRI